MYGLDFRVVPSFPDYAVSRAGLVIRVTNRTNGKFGRVIKSFVGCGGYVRVVLSHQHALVHRLVAETHIGPCPTGCVVNHKDGDKLNNFVTNLEYVTQKQNIRHAMDAGRWNQIGETHSQAKLSEKEVLEIRAAKGGRGLGNKLAKKYDVSKHTISLIRLNKIWQNCL
jgi:hypothetical protein